MEDALAQGITQAYLRRETLVLILVVMEDALAL